MGRPQLGFPRLCFVAVTANGIAIGFDHTPTRGQAPFFCPVPDTKPRIPNTWKLASTRNNGRKAEVIEPVAEAGKRRPKAV
jgi:hypothetical protein